MANSKPTPGFRFWLWLILLVGVIVPRRLRADRRQEWEAELRCRETLLAEWERLDWRHKLDLLRRSVVLVALIIPAWRAARLDPLKSLRQ